MLIMRKSQKGDVAMAKKNGRVFSRLFGAKPKVQRISVTPADLRSALQYLEKADELHNKGRSLDAVPLLDQVIAILGPCLSNNQHVDTKPIAYDMKLLGLTYKLKAGIQGYMLSTDQFASFCDQAIKAFEVFLAKNSQIDLAVVEELGAAYISKGLRLMDDGDLVGSVETFDRASVFFAGLSKRGVGRQIRGCTAKFEVYRAEGQAQQGQEVASVIADVRKAMRVLEEEIEAADNPVQQNRLKAALNSARRYFRQ